MASRPYKQSMKAKHLLLTVILGLPIGLLIVHFGTPIDLISFFYSPSNTNNEIIFKSESGSITAKKSDIIDTLIGRTRDEKYAVQIKSTVQFGEEIFLFTSKNLGKSLTITAFGVQVGKPEKIRYSFIDRIQITGLTKKEADLIISGLKETKEE